MNKLKCLFLGHTWDNGGWTRQCKCCKEIQQKSVEIETGEVHWESIDNPFPVAVWWITILIIVLIEIYFWSN